MPEKSRFCQTKKQQLHFGLVNPDWVQLYLINCTISTCHIRPFSQKMKFSIKDFVTKCGQIRRRLWIWSHSLKKCQIENFIFYAVKNVHVSIFSISRQAFFLLNQHVKLFFVSSVSFYQQTFLKSFYLILLHLSIQILTLEIHDFTL